MSRGRRQKPLLNSSLDITSNPYNWIWRDAKCILGLQEGGGDPHDLTKKISKIILTDFGGGTDASVWRGNIHGMGVGFPGVTRNYIEFVSKDIEFTATEPYTLCWFLTMNDEGPNDLNQLLFRSDAGGGIYWVIRRGTTYGGNHKRLWIRHNGADVVANGPIMEPSEFRALVITWDGTTVRVYIDGVETNTKADSTGTAWSLDGLFASEVSAGDNAAGDLSIFIAAGRAWTPTEVCAWSIDPFGFLDVAPSPTGFVAVTTNINTQEKRMCAAGVGRPFMRATFSVATPTQSWRISVGQAYCGNSLAAAAEVLLADSGFYAITGITANLIGDFTLGAPEAAVGSYAITGVVALTVGDFTLIAPEAVLGVYSVTGVLAELIGDFTLGAGEAATGSYAITGITISLEIGFPVDVGSYVVTGVAANLILDATLGAGNAVTGSYSISGVNASLIADYVENMIVGAYNLTGVSADLIKEIILIADTGVYTITGISADAVGDMFLNAVTGSYSIAGVTSIIVGDFILPSNAAVGSYTITGIVALTVGDFTLGSGDAVTGSYVITGITANLVFSGGVDDVLNADPGSYIITGILVDLELICDVVFTREPDPVTVTYTDDLIVANQPIIAMLVKSDCPGIWVFDVDDETTPRQAGLVLDDGFYHVNQGPEIPRGLKMTVVDKLISLET